MRLPSRFALSALAFVALSLGGCLPPRPVWLPDSSGFFYPSKSGIGHYDLERRTHRIIADLPSQKTFLPGVSPDGKQMALVRIERDRDRQTAQVLLADLDGKVTHRSKVFPFGAGSTSLGEAETRDAAAEWSPRGDNILIADVDGRLAVYRRNEQVFTSVEGVKTTVLDVFYDGSIAGDGSGFLAVREGAKEDEDNLFKGVVFVEWDGRIHDMTMSFETSSALKRVFEAEGLAGPGPKYFAKGTWSGPVVTHPWYRGLVRIDCVRYTVTYEDDPRISDEYDEIKRSNVLMETRLAGGESVIRVCTPDGKGELQRVEAWFPEQKRRETLIENVTNFTLSNAPDARTVAVLYKLKDDETIRFLVIDASGAVVSNFEAD